MLSHQPNTSPARSRNTPRSPLRSGPGTTPMSSRQRLQRQHSSTLWRQNSQRVQRLASVDPTARGRLSSRERQVDIIPEGEEDLPDDGAEKRLSTASIASTHSPLASHRASTPAELLKRKGSLGTLIDASSPVDIVSGEQPRGRCTPGYMGPSCSPMYALTCTLAVIVIFLLKAAFLNVFALIIHDESPFDQYDAVVFR